MKKVLLGLSGGVDSAVSAALLKKNGYEVYGLYLNTGDEAALQDAVRTAEFLSVPLDVAEVHREMEENVCRPFEECYLHGKTPIPCIICNPTVKFRMLCEAANRIDAPYIATGHYARAEDGMLYKGRPENDQSYMLCRLTREQIGRVVFPLAPYCKSEVRAAAAELNIPVAQKADSQEICFIPSKDYRAWMQSRGNIPVEGDFVFRGEKFGRHTGIWNYTVGQRLPGFYNGRKLYVGKIIPERNEIELVLWEDLFFTELYAEKFNWLIDEPTSAITAEVRVRHTRWETPACSAAVEGGLVHISCADPVRAPAPGQSAVLYRGDLVLGGGFII